MAARPTSSGRARRLLAMLPLLASGERSSLASLASAAGSDVATVADDLALLSLCGADQADPNALVPVLVQDGSAVTFGRMPALEEPVRLTFAETAAVTAALEACGVDPEGSLGRGLAAVSSEALDLEHIAHTVRAAAAPGGLARTHAALTAAAASRRAVRLTHASSGEEEACERSVLPWELFMWRGNWYLRGWDEARDAERTFRLDRVERVEVTGRVFERPADFEPATSAAPDARDLPRAEILFEGGAPDLTEREWPGATFEALPDGRVRATVPYAGTAWIARRVMARAGTAVVVSPDEVRTAVAALARTELERLARPR